MPQIHTFIPACWLDPLPQHPEDRFTLLTDDGWADQSALFFPERFTPAPLRMVLTGSSLIDLKSKVTALRALRRKKVRVDDGLYPMDGCLVLGVRVGPAERCAMIVGGSAPADTWEQEVVVLVLQPSPAVA